MPPKKDQSKKKTSEKGRGRPRVYKEGERKQLTIYLSRKAAIDLKIYAAKNEKRLNEIIEEVISRFLEKSK